MSCFDETFLITRVTLALGGLLTSTFSCVLLAELAVGRIILARNPSSTGLEAVLDRECGRSLPDGGECEACLRALDAVGVMARLRVPALAFFKLEGLRERPEVVLALAEGAEAVVEFGGRACLAVDDDRASPVRAAGFVLSRAGVEDREGLVGALLAVASDVRVGLGTGGLFSLFPVAVVVGLDTRVLVGFSLSALAAEVEVRGCAVVLETGAWEVGLVVEAVFPP